MELSIQSTAVEYKGGNMISFKKSNKYECCLCSKKKNVFDVTVVDKDKKVNMLCFCTDCLQEFVSLANICISTPEMKMVSIDTLEESNG